MIYQAVQHHFPNRRLLFDITDSGGMDPAQNRRRYSFRVLPGLAEQPAEGRPLAETPFVFAAMERSAFSSSDRQYLLPAISRLGNTLAKLLPDNAPVSAVTSLERIAEYMALPNITALLPRAFVPQGAVCQEISDGPQLTALLSVSDERMQETLVQPLRQAFINLGWE